MTTSLGIKFPAPRVLMEIRMYIYIIAHAGNGTPEDLRYFQRLHFQNEHDTNPMAIFSRTGKPKIYRSDKAARAAIQRLMSHGGYSNISYISNDGNLYIKEIDLYNNCVLNQYY